MSQLEIAAALSSLLARPVRAESVPREKWSAIFKSQGMHDPVPRTRMLDGFNEGWTRFERSPTTHISGTVSIADVLKTVVAAAA